MMAAFDYFFVKTPWPPGSTLGPHATRFRSDTRNGTGHSGKVGPGQTVNLSVDSQGGLPASGIQAVVINVTGKSTGAPTFDSGFPYAVLSPLSTNLDFTATDTVPNLGVVKGGTTY